MGSLFKLSLNVFKLLIIKNKDGEYIYHFSLQDENFLQLVTKLF